MSGRILATGALVFNAFVWGTSWWPFRWLQERGVHALWATAIAFSAASLLIVALRPRAVRQLATTPVLWLLVAAAGVTNATFNWAVTIGDVVRVVLLFYLMPVWALLLARVVLGEKMTPIAIGRVALALAGAAIVLWPAGAGVAAASNPLADALAIAGGAAFALNNVILRREAKRPEEGRALAMFVGGALVALGLAVALAAGPGVAGGVAALPPPAAGWLAMTGLLALVFLAGNLALQYGAARLAAQRTAVVMPIEVLFAAGSAVALGAAVATPGIAIGGALIVGSAMLAALGRSG